MKRVTIYQDEINAIFAEEKFFNSIDSKDGPLVKESSKHHGEGGASTLYYQHGKLVAFTSRIRNSFNWTILICIDLRINLEKYEAHIKPKIVE